MHLVVDLLDRAHVPHAMAGENLARNNIGSYTRHGTTISSAALTAVSSRSTICLLVA